MFKWVDMNDIIIDSVLENEDNAKIALSIIYSCIDIKKKIIINFLKALETSLKELFPEPEWRIENSLKENVFDRYRGFFVAKTQWGDTYKIGFQTGQSNVKSFSIGVLKLPQVQLIQNLKAEIDSKYRPGDTDHQWWEWKQSIGDGYGDWDNETTLMKLYRQEEAIQYFCDHLKRIADIASPLIDAAVAQTSTLKELVCRIVDVAHPLCILLFGSAARGNMRPDSDLDVLVVVPDGTHRRQTAQTLHEHMAGFPVPVDILVTTPADLDRHKANLGLIYHRILREGRKIYIAKSS